MSTTVISSQKLAAQREKISALEAENERLRKAVALLNSMVLSGEQHSDTSQAIVRQALDTPTHPKWPVSDEVLDMWANDLPNTPNPPPDKTTGNDGPKLGMEITREGAYDENIW